MITGMAIITTMTSVGLRQVHWTYHDLGVLPPHKGEGRRAASTSCLASEKRHVR